MVQTLTEFLGVKDARRLYQKGQVNGRTDRFHPSEYVNQWLARHRIPELVFPDTPATVLRDLRKISLSHSLCGGNKIESKGLQVKARALTEKFMKEFLGYTWGLLLIKSPEAFHALDKHFQEHKERYKYMKWLPCSDAQEIPNAFMKSELTGTPLRFLTDVTRKAIEADSSARQAVQEYISQSWLIEKHEAAALEEFTSSMNPEFHDRPQPPTQSHEFGKLLANVTSTMESWEERRMLPRVGIILQKVENGWGTSVHLVDVSSGQVRSQSEADANRIRLFYRQRIVPDYLSRPSYFYLALGRSNVCFETLPRPECA
jgi:hypothetical protein